ncbi:MAG: chemotaxis protein CheA [Gemmatimonadota bacterium]|nr:chemotaxis protein CheA [Gemmatimonadota bacterium]
MAQKDLETIIESLSSELVMANPWDLQAMNRVMELLKQVQDRAEDEQEKLLQDAAGAAIGLSEEMIIQSPEEQSASMEVLNRTVAAMQHAVIDGAETAAGLIPAELGLDLQGLEEVAPAGVEEGILADFLSRQEGVLQEMEQYILTIEKKGLAGDYSNGLKRLFHSLKGEAGMLGLGDVERVCHETENLIGNAPLERVTEGLLSVKDWLMQSFNSWAGKGNAPQGVEEFLVRIRDYAAPQAAGLELGQGAEPGGNRAGKKEQATETVAQKDEPPVDKVPDKQNKTDKKKVKPAPAVEKAKKNVFVPSEGDQSLLCDFILEAQGHLDNSDVQLLKVEQDPGDEEALNSVFRSFHTIKGVAGFLDLRDIMELAHVSEDLLDRARKGQLQLNGQAVDTIFESIDTLRSLVSGIEQALASGETLVSDDSLAPLLQKLKVVMDGGQITAPAVEEPPHVDPDKKLGEILVESGHVNEKSIKEALSESEDPAPLGEKLVKKKEVAARDVAAALRVQKSSRKPQEKVTVKEVVKIDTERLDRLLDAIGELVIAESIVSQNEEILSNISTAMARNLNHLDKITRVVQELGMSMRMMTIHPVFQKMARLVRDLARKSGKEIEFITSGEETELDRTVIERIGDPLVHMIRNSVDHGIESRDERTKLGKPPVGRIELRAFHRGGSIYIEVADDGKGLDREAILAKGIERGLVSQGAELSDREVFNMVFMPGFSTAKKITDVSGRGVGMDVVKKNIDALRGAIDISSKKGEGSTVSMRLPLTLAIIDGMIIQVAKERFIIPTLSVVESLRPEKENISTVSGRAEMLSVRGSLFPLFRISRVFGITGAVEDPTQALCMIVEDQDRKVALLVDNLIGQQQVVIKNLGDGLGKVRGISGGAIMADGQVGLILDMAGIVKVASGRMGNGAGKGRDNRTVKAGSGKENGQVISGKAIDEEEDERVNHDTGEDDKNGGGESIVQQIGEGALAKA